LPPTPALAFTQDQPEGVPSPDTETLMPDRFWLSTLTDGEWATGPGLAGISPVGVRGRGAPPAADASVSESTFSPAVEEGLVVRMCVPALNLMPCAELPQPGDRQAPLDRAVAEDR